MLGLGRGLKFNFFGVGLSLEDCDFGLMASIFEVIYM